MIYIDPPYNTGNDFIYRDDCKVSRAKYAVASGEVVKDEESGETTRMFKNTETNGQFHSDWCTMIYMRLVLARDLLTEDGVIFISIDDCEIENLRKICDEIFGAENNAGVWFWYKSATPPNLSHKIKRNIEYVLVYERNKNSSCFRGIQKSSKSDDPITKPQNSIKQLSFPAGTIHFRQNDGLIKAGIYGTKKFPNRLVNDVIIAHGVNENVAIFENRFVWTQSKLENEISAGTVINCSLAGVISYKKANYAPEIPPSLIDDSVGVLTTEEAGKQLEQLMSEKVFDYPKPVSLLHYLLSFKEGDIILDFFSGSATTAHAVMQLNAEDGGNRKFIMVQYPEDLDKNLQQATTEETKKTLRNAIAFCDSLGVAHKLTEIGKERIRRAGEKIKEEHGLAAVDLDVGFRVFKLEDSNMKDVFYSADAYSQKTLDELISNIKEDRTDLDLLYGCLLEWGVELSLPHTSEVIDGVTVHTVNGGDLIACFDPDIPESAIRTIAKRQPLRAVFRDSSFAGAPQKINVEEIFKLLSPATTVKVI